MNLGQRIDDGYATLSRQERRAADFILENLGDIAVYSATELAERSGVSKATVSRLFRRLGYSGSQEFRDEARQLRNRGVPVMTEPGDGAPTDDPYAAALAGERRNIDRLAGLGSQVTAASALIAEAREVVVIGSRSSYPIALHLGGQLIQTRPGVRMAPQPGQSLGEELGGLGPEDVVVLIALRRRPATTEALLDACVELGVPVVLIADPSGTRLARRVDHWLECPIDSAGPFDAHGAALALCTAIASATGAALGPAGGQRATRIARLYASLGEVEQA